MLNITNNNRSAKPKRSKEEVMASQPKFPAKPVVGRIVRVVDYGMQPMQDWQTKEAKEPEHRLGITVEFPKVRNEDDRPAWITKEMSVKSSENAALTKFLLEVAPEKVDLQEGHGKYEGMRFVNIDPSFSWNDDVINTPVLCNTGITSGGYNKIVSISGVPEGMEVGELENDPLVYELDPENPDGENWPRLNQFEKTRIMNGVDDTEVWKNLDVTTTEDVPF